MKLLVLSVLIVVIAAISTTEAVPNSRSLIYNRRRAPAQYRLVGFPTPQAKVSFTLGLKQQNLEEFERRFWAISTPGSSMYRQFMTNEEILDMIAPSADDREVVLSWLRANGALNIEDRRDSLRVTTTVEIAERLFDTKLYLFYFTDRNTTVIKSLGEYSLPTEIYQIVDIVSGISDFPLNANRLHMSPDQTFGVIPATLQVQYNVPKTASAAASNQGVIEFGSGEYYNPTSLQTFAKGVGVTIAPLSSNHIINPLPPSGIEGTLDIQYIAAVGTGATNWYWTEADWLYDWSTSFFAASSKPDIVSVSYAWYELAQCDIDPDECQTLGVNSQQYVAKVNTEFQKIGAAGVSILTASGDSGANGRTDPTCTASQLRPDYPAVSPYVTSVGATQLNNPSTPLPNNPPICSSGAWSCYTGGQETAVSYDVASFTSGGGFSWISPCPSYQQDVVSAYLKSGVNLPPASYYNASNRGHPDVSSIGTAVLIYSEQEGGWVSVGGTSASTPSFAGYMSILNNIVKTKTGKPLGFLNPFLYKMYADSSSTFRDITVGDNICTEYGCASSCRGFYATTGWDPVTGLGVANVQEMINYVNTHF